MPKDAKWYSLHREQGRVMMTPEEEILAERVRQDIKWGEQNHDPFTWLTILMEEVSRQVMTQTPTVVAPPSRGMALSKAERGW